jgi:hypothetical protein
MVTVCENDYIREITDIFRFNKAGCPHAETPVPLFRRRSAVAVKIRVALASDQFISR